MTEKDLEIQDLRRKLAKSKEENRQIRETHVRSEIVALLISENDLAIEKLLRENEQLRREYNDCRNELCMKCGYYRCAHIGACDSCKWKERKE